MLISVLSYYLFSQVAWKVDGANYFLVFLAGLLFSFGFTTPIAVGFFITASPSNLYLAAIIGGLGALLSDLFIFKLIRLSFMDEFRRLENTAPLKKLTWLIDRKPLIKIKTYLLFIFAGIVIASPLPDELGVSMLAGLTKIKIHILALISFVMNCIGIWIMFMI